MPTCFVPGCGNSSTKKKFGVSFHSIPNTLKSEWLNAISRDPNLLIIQQRICSEHFRNDDFEQFGSRRKLKANVIPMLNLPVHYDLNEITKIVAIPSTSTEIVSKIPTESSVRMSESNMDKEHEPDIISEHNVSVKELDEITDTVAMPSTLTEIILKTPATSPVRMSKSSTDRESEIEMLLEIQNQIQDEKTIPKSNAQEETETVGSVINSILEKEIIQNEIQDEKKIPKSNAQRQRIFRQNQKDKILKNEIMNQARKKENAERAKRFRERLKTKKQYTELDSDLSSKEDNNQETDHRYATNYEELVNSQFQTQQPMNTDAQQINSSFSSFETSYKEHNISGDGLLVEMKRQSTTRKRKLPKNNFGEAYKLPTPQKKYTNRMTQTELYMDWNEFLTTARLDRSSMMVMLGLPNLTKILKFFKTRIVKETFMKFPDQLILTIWKYRFNLNFDSYSYMFSYDDITEFNLNIFNDCFHTGTETLYKYVQEYEENKIQEVGRLVARRIYLDVFEIPVASHLTFDKMNYSTHRGSTTFKTIVLFVGNLHYFYVSDLYGGGTNVSHIIKTSQIGNVVRPDDYIIYSKKIQPSEAELINANIMHSFSFDKKDIFSTIEMRYRKNFKILNNSLPVNFWPIANQIFHNCVSLYNMSLYLRLQGNLKENSDALPTIFLH